MNTARWENRGEFRLLDLIASFEFKTESSLCFQLGNYGKFIGNKPAFFPIGWLDVHHPCLDHIKTQIRVCLPERYHDLNVMHELVRQIFECLEIPADETFEAKFFAPPSQPSIERATDRDGFSDRMYGRY